MSIHTWSRKIGNAGHLSPELMIKLRQTRLSKLRLPSEQPNYPKKIGIQLEIPFPNF